VLLKLLVVGVMLQKGSQTIKQLSFLPKVISGAEQSQHVPVLMTLKDIPNLAPLMASTLNLSIMVHYKLYKSSSNQTKIS